MGGKIVGSYMDREMVFTYAEKGTCLYRIGSRQYRFGPGQAILLAPHVPHTLKPDRGDMRHHIVHFSFPAGRTLGDWPPVIANGASVPRSTRTSWRRCSSRSSPSTAGTATARRPMKR
jgi:hypothetical protein